MTLQPPVVDDGLCSILDDTFERVGRAVSGHEARVRAQEIGTVRFVGSGIARVEGLPNVRSEELVRFPGGIAQLLVEHLLHADPTMPVGSDEAQHVSGQRTLGIIALVLAREFQRRFAQVVDDIVANCGSEARTLLLSREAGLRRGQVVRLSKLSPAKQQAYLEELTTTGKRPRRRRSARPRSMTLPSEPKALVATLLARLEPKDAGQVAKLLAEALAKGK